MLAGLHRSILLAEQITKDGMQPVAWIRDHHGGAKANPQHRQAPAELYEAFKLDQDDLLVRQVNQLVIDFDLDSLKHFTCRQVLAP